MPPPRQGEPRPLEQRRRLSTGRPREDADDDAASILTQLPAYTANNLRNQSPAPSYQTNNPATAHTSPQSFVHRAGHIVLQGIHTTRTRQKPSIPDKLEQGFRNASLNRKGTILKNYAVTQEWLDRYLMYCSRQPWFVHKHENEITKVMSLLIQHGANVNGEDSSQNNGGNTPLLAALSLGHGTIAGWLINHGADVNIEGANGYTLLHLAIKLSSTSLGTDLAARGADLNAKDSSGQTPLIEAIQVGLIALGKELILQGADVNLRNSQGLTPLHAAFRFKSSEGQLRTLLLDRGADVNSKESSGYQNAIIHDAVRRADVHIVEYIINKGADIHVKNIRERTAVFTALKRDVNMLKLLFHKGAAVNETDINGNTILHCWLNERTTRSSMNLLPTILEHTPGLLIANKEGHTPIHLAIMTRPTSTPDNPVCLLFKQDPMAFNTCLRESDPRLTDDLRSHLTMTTNGLWLDFVDARMEQFLDYGLRAQIVTENGPSKEF